MKPMLHALLCSGLMALSAAAALLIVNPFTTEDAMNRPQTPGRVEALRAVMRQGIDRSTADMLHLAGFNRPTMRAPAAPPLAGITFASGIDRLSQKERAALPF